MRVTNCGQTLRERALRWIARSRQWHLVVTMPDADVRCDWARERVVPRTNLILDDGVADTLDQVPKSIHTTRVTQEYRSSPPIFQWDRVTENIIQFTSNTPNVRPFLDLGEDGVTA